MMESGSQRPPTEIRVVRIRGEDRRLGAGALLVIGAIVLAVLKPWGEPLDRVGATAAGALADGAARIPVTTSASLPAADSSGPAADTSASLTAAAASSPRDEQCYGDSWRIYSVEHDLGRFSRWWISVEPNAASGPLDPAIPTQLVVGETVLGMGFCSPYGAVGGPGIRSVTGWRIDDVTGPVRIGLSPYVGAPRPNPDRGGVYRPPDPPGAARGDSWAAGRYVFAIKPNGPAAQPAWFAVEVVLLAPRPSATP